MKIEYINNVGCLRNVSNIDLGRNMFIYGLNGVGKSTYKRLIKAAFIENSKLIGSYGVSKTQINAKFKILDKTVEFHKGKLLKPFENIDLHVFDDDYLQNIIFENGIIKDENKTNYYNILVGRGISSKVKLLNEKSLQNQSLCSEIDKITNELETELSLMKNIYQGYDEISSLLKLQFQSVKVTDAHFSNELLKNIDKLGEIETRWLNKGITIRKSKDICPFCGQHVSEEIQNNLINKYKQIEIDYKENEEIAFDRIDNFIETIRTFIELEQKTYVDTNNEVLEDLNAILRKCYEKQDDLTKKIQFNNLNSVGTISKKIYHIENQIEALKIVVGKYKINDMFNIDIDEDAESKYKNLRTSINNLFIDDNKAKELLSKISQIRKTALTCSDKIADISTNQYRLINTNLNFINEKFKEYDFNYKFDFKSIKHKVLAKENSFLLNLSLVPIINVSSEIQFDKKYIKDCLSEGEKSIIAWVIFLCEIKEQLTEKRHFIILDDPISSYDAYRRFNLIFDLEEIFINSAVDKEILLLTHERSFTNSAKYIKKMNFFNLQDYTFIKVNPEEIIESDMKSDIEYIRKNTQLENNQTFIEFLVRSRNLLEYSLLNVKLLGTKYFKLNEYEHEYACVSSVLHMRSNILPVSYIKYVEREFHRIVRNYIHIDYTRVNLNNIDLTALLPTSTDNPYINRVIIDNYFQNILSDNGVTIPYTATTGKLLEEAKPYISVEKFRKTKLILPILNIFNHPNLNYGVRRIDIDVNKKELVRKLVIEIIN
jgi:wobble nucleotide-excising tRNase